MKKKFGLKSKVVYPYIDISRFKKIKLNPKEQKYISFIGGENAMKGYDIVLKIAKKMPEEKFLIVGPYKKMKKKKNILFMPWQDDVLNIYKKSKLILMPSRCEAYGRIPVEASILKIPVISSSRGGLPESNKKGLVIKKFEDINEWLKQIKSQI